MLKTIILALSLLLAACGASKDQPANKASDAPLAAKDTVFGDDLKALDKARQVQGTVMQDKANTDAAIDAATTPPAAER